jgi:peptidoglycan/xylan/chitin deacetylase (PgdA/CDA1 family)
MTCLACRCGASLFRTLGGEGFAVGPSITWLELARLIFQETGMIANPKAGTMLKRALLAPLFAPGCVEALASLTDTRATIFMLHRFSTPELGVFGQDPAQFRRDLAHLRKLRYRFMPILDLLQSLLAGEPLKKAIAFTIDDGYFDHAEVAAPIFAEFDCPVTTFLVARFSSGEDWFWWDKLTYILECTKKPQVEARLGTTRISYVLTSPEARASADQDLCLRCRNSAEQDRLQCVLDLSRDAEVHVPSSPPRQFAPLSWDVARKLERTGMTFGPHTVTHPVLSSTDDRQAEFEITESWNRLKQEVANPVPIFCYPNGRRQDFGAREIATIQRLGLAGAVAGKPGKLSSETLRESEIARYQVPRFAYPDSFVDLLQFVSGLEFAKARIRAALR